MVHPLPSVNPSTFSRIMITLPRIPLNNCVRLYLTASTLSLQDKPQIPKTNINYQAPTQMATLLPYPHQNSSHYTKRQSPKSSTPTIYICPVGPVTCSAGARDKPDSHAAGAAAAWKSKIQRMWGPLALVVRGPRIHALLRGWAYSGHCWCCSGLLSPVCRWKLARGSSRPGWPSRGISVGTWSAGTASFTCSRFSWTRGGSYFGFFWWWWCWWFGLLSVKRSAIWMYFEGRGVLEGCWNRGFEVWLFCVFFFTWWFSIEDVFFDTYYFHHFQISINMIL